MPDYNDAIAVVEKRISERKQKQTEEFLHESVERGKKAQKLKQDPAWALLVQKLEESAGSSKKELESILSRFATIESYPAQDLQAFRIEAVQAKTVHDLCLQLIDYFDELVEKGEEANLNLLSLEDSD